MIHHEEIHEEEEKIKDKITTTVLSWLRILLPLILGALGWYVSQIIAPMESRITLLEEQQHQILIYKSSDSSQMETIEAKLNKIIQDHEDHKKGFVRKELFDKITGILERDIENIEDRIYDIKHAEK